MTPIKPTPCFSASRANPDLREILDLRESAATKETRALQVTPATEIGDLQAPSENQDLQASRE